MANPTRSVSSAACCERTHASPGRSPAEALIGRLLERADIRLQGGRPWDLQIHDPALAADLVRRGSLALGEGYVRGAWDCEDLAGFFTRLLRQDLGSAGLGLDGLARWRQGWQVLRERLADHQSPRRAFAVGRRHYDIDPRVYAAMLDKQRIYSCGYWRQASTLEEAQEHKLRLICSKLELQPGQHLLDIGCGWGGLAAYAARHHGVRVTGITVSRQQELYCRETLAELPVEIRCCDYRRLAAEPPGSFDRIVSVGMLEHVGRRHDRTYFGLVSRLLADDGLVLIQTIGTATTTWRSDPWIDTYIFPNGRLPSAQQLSRGLEGHFLLEDWENFGLDYDRTLRAWWQNFNDAWPEIGPHLSPAFYRLWTYYLLSCAGFFRSRQGQLWQLVLSKPSRGLSYASRRPGMLESEQDSACETGRSGQGCSLKDAVSERTQGSGDGR